MEKMQKLQEVLYERLHRRPPGIDKLDRLWEAAVLLPLVQTEEGIAVLFEERAHSLRRQPVTYLQTTVSLSVIPHVTSLTVKVLSQARDRFLSYA